MVLVRAVPQKRLDSLRTKNNSEKSTAAVVHEPRQQQEGCFYVRIALYAASKTAVVIVENYVGCGTHLVTSIPFFLYCRVEARLRASLPPPKARVRTEAGETAHPSGGIAGIRGRGAAGRKGAVGLRAAGKWYPIYHGDS